MGEIVSREATDRELRTQLLAKLADVQRDVGVIEKDKRNEFHRYDYASIEAIVLGTRDHLLERGLVVLAGRRSLSERQRQTSQGEATVTTVDLTFEIFDVETGFSIAFDWFGRGEDPADKGIAKALTDARKTFLIQQLNLARGDDTEGDPATDERSSANGAVNMVAEAKGLSDAKLNHVLVAVGMPAQQKPFGAFTRIPKEAVEPIRAELAKARE
jgi:hypothetical protein